MATPFAGFPERPDITPVPNLYLTAVLPLIDDPAEVQGTLLAFHRLAQKRTPPKVVAFSELLSDVPGASEFEDVRARLKAGLDKAAARGVLLEVQALDGGGRSESFYMVNTARNQRTAESLRTGQVALPRLPDGWEVASPPPLRANIFVLYEENIGLITPILADELREAEERYPAAWIAAAFKEAVGNNKRTWRYIARILESWAGEGKGGRTRTPGRYPAALDPEWGTPPRDTGRR
ncbi:MAG: DnaD domain protein [Chloroflexi bacterium]|nr:DnaD domain protein [Chloroflexota bacterium]